MDVDQQEREKQTEGSVGDKNKGVKAEAKQEQQQVGAGQEALPSTSSSHALHCISCDYFTGSSLWKKM